MNLKDARRAVLCGADGTEPMWNPYGLGRTANRLLLFTFKMLRIVGFTGDAAWKITERVELILVPVRGRKAA
jgi:hypothetical protein